MKSDWLFCCLVRAPSFLFADPTSLGMFELTKRTEARPGWESALQESAKQRAITVGNDFIRARCFFLDTTFEDAHQSGVLHAKELVGLLPLVHILTPFEFVRVGFVANLRHGAALPLPPTFEEWQRRRSGITASIDELATEPSLTLNSLLVAHPSVFGELGAALRRSTHWQGLARQAEDSGEELLALWMACESLSRVNENESLTPKFVSGLGLPTGRYLVQLRSATQAAFQAEPKVTTWRKKLASLFETLRNARNKITHAGYRGLDMPEFFNRDDLLLVRAAMRLLLPRLQRLALNGLRLRFTTIAEVWDRFEPVFMLERDTRLAVGEAVGTVIFTLEQPERFA